MCGRAVASASDAFAILDEFSYLKSGCGDARELPDSVRSYEASKFGFRCKRADCRFIHVKTQSGRRNLGALAVEAAGESIEAGGKIATAASKTSEKGLA